MTSVRNVNCNSRLKYVLHLTIFSNKTTVPPLILFVRIVCYDQLCIAIRYFPTPIFSIENRTLEVKKKKAPQSVDRNGIYRFVMHEAFRNDTITLTIIIIKKIIPSFNKPSTIKPKFVPLFYILRAITPIYCEIGEFLILVSFCNFWPT